ncbi:hypothetical protein Droror1_Dr00009671 [Drosera rotundifolia]
MEEFEVERKTLKPGDHIYSWRLGGIYAHHGVFVNEGRVIHYNPGAGQEVATGTKLDHHISSISSPSSQRPPCQVCGDQSMAGGVISSCLDCFLKGGKLYLFQYGVSQPYFLRKKGGTCTTLGSDESDNVLYRAEYLLENGFGEYNLVTNNCEDFALYCKTGKKGMWVRSGQVSTVVAALNAAVPLVMGGVFIAATVAMSAPLGFIFLPIGMTATTSVATFLGVKINLDKGEPVPVRPPPGFFGQSHSSIHERPMPIHHSPSEIHAMHEQHFQAHQRRMSDHEWIRGHR